MFDSPIVRVVNNWLHDVATGLWAASLLVVVVLVDRAGALDSAAEKIAAHALVSAGTLMFWLMVGSLVAIAVTGAARLLYWRAETPPEELASKRPALIGKHVAFLVVYGPGTAFAWWLLTTTAV